MKKSHVIVYAFILLCSFIFNQKAHAATVPDPIGDIYVQDFANILNDNQKNELIQLGAYMEDHTDVQLTVLTIDSLEDLTVEEYALQAFNDYKLGGKENHNAVLLLLALDDRKIRIEVGYGVDDPLPDEKVGRIIDIYALPYLEDNHISEAIVNTYKQLYNELSTEYALGKEADAKGFEYGYGDKRLSSIFTFAIILTVLIVLVILDFRFFKGVVSLTLLRLITRGRRKSGARKRNR